MKPGVFVRILVPLRAMGLLDVAVVRTVDVHRVRYSFKMTGIAAEPMLAWARRATFAVVAGVVYLQPLFNLTEVKFVDKTMREFHRWLGWMESSIPLSCRSCRPWPAFVWAADFDFGPEPV